jgi:Na+-transporting NADH:ubiquinone oxidoreductase subunit A
MADFKLKKGFDIRAAGKADLNLVDLGAPRKVALQPVEFRGIKVKLEVETGNIVKKGSTLFTSKENPELRFVSPISGTVSEINRGERRVLMEIVIENDNKNEFEPVKKISENEVAGVSREDIIAAMLKSGLWPLVRQRPFSKIANPSDEPRDIFISAMDTAPLAADVNFILHGLEKEFQHGIDLLAKMTPGKVYLNTDGSSKGTFFNSVKNVEKNTFTGIHPAGNVGVHLHHINPIKHGQVIWYVSPYDVAMIGKSFLDGQLSNEKIIAIAGKALKDRHYVKTVCGAPIAFIIKEDNVNHPEVRYVSGDVLSGRKVLRNGYVCFYDNLISVIPEGTKERKLIGWYLPGLKKRSHSKSFLSTWLGRSEFDVDTLVNGGERAFIVSGDYERVLPMDIYPVYLIKSILANDIEEMEGLGILELSEEDVALCSYICPSKNDFGGILRSGLDLIEKEG